MPRDPVTIARKFMNEGDTDKALNILKQKRNRCITCIYPQDIGTWVLNEKRQLKPPLVGRCVGCEDWE